MLKVYNIRQSEPFEVVTCELYDKSVETGEYDFSPAISMVASLSDFNHHVVQIQCGCKNYILGSTLSSAINDFLNFLDEPHWRDTIKHQFIRYGELFESIDD